MPYIVENESNILCHLRNTSVLKWVVNEIGTGTLMFGGTWNLKPFNREGVLKIKHLKKKDHCLSNSSYNKVRFL